MRANEVLISAPKIINVPYNGSGTQGLAVLNGKIGMMIGTFQLTGNDPRRQAASAVGMFSDKRLSTLPDMPTMMKQVVGTVSRGYAVLVALAGNTTEQNGHHHR